MIGTIRRRDVHGRCWESVIGPDVDEERAAELVESGQAEYGPDYDLPPALYLAIDLEIRGCVYSAGSLLTVGGEITESEALLLMFSFDQVPGGEVASFPGGGVG